MLYDKVYAAIATHMKKKGVNQKSREALRGLGNSLSVRMPDAAWLIDVLGVMTPNDEIFTKSYVWTKPQESRPPETTFDNVDGLFDGLPRLSEKELRKTNRMQRPKAERQRIALLKLERQKAQLQERELVLTVGKSKKPKPFEAPPDSDLRKSHTRKSKDTKMLDITVMNGVSKLNLSGVPSNALN